MQICSMTKHAPHSATSHAPAANSVSGLGKFWIVRGCISIVQKSYFKMICYITDCVTFFTYLTVYPCNTTALKLRLPGPRFNIRLRRLIVRSREISKPPGLYLVKSDCPEIWQAHRQHCCLCACQISERCDIIKCQYRGFETYRYLTIRRLVGYWKGPCNR